MIYLTMMLTGLINENSNLQLNYDALLRFVTCLSFLFQSPFREYLEKLMEQPMLYGDRLCSKLLLDGLWIISLPLLSWN